MADSEKPRDKRIGRREFLVGGGAAVAAGVLAASIPGTADAAVSSKTYPTSRGYLVYDSRLCLGCQSCMFACSLTHEGVANPSLSRIQIIRDAPSFTKYPYDVVVSVCRQCVSPLCVQVCPTGACHVDEANGNIRRIDQDKCIGCKRCIQSCPHDPHRTIWNPVIKKSSKCDLCESAPYWNEKGGPDGKQACVETCPVKALKLVTKAPLQTDINGYDLNLAPPLPKAKPQGFELPKQEPGKADEKGGN
ncbi:MAG: 4Fe-4S dicluster domain-containing protein [Deltaproteobacteria bacterium]|jgi:protein NrfC|nr:4Fe-4S dicluster domain-containing protein [Deltaproteobacteria bacterium]